MGYSTDYRNRLCCDSCGVAGGVRKRKCTATVTSDSLRGSRFTLPYCPAPALCNDCFKKHGGSKGLHARCVEPAAKSQAEYDATEALLTAGEKLNVAAWGSWHDTVPADMVGVLFQGSRGQGREYRLLSQSDYDARSNHVALSKVQSQEWVDHA